jgi:hypothetical protein
MTEEDYRQLLDNQRRANQIDAPTSRFAPSNEEPKSEAGIQSLCVEFMQQDGWRPLRTDPVSDRGRGKGFGELGMPDYLFIRYDGMDNVLEFAEPVDSATEICVAALCQIIWIEWKSYRGEVKKHQRAWHIAERARGALVWVATEDFPPTVDGFREYYAASGLMRRARWW